MECGRRGGPCEPGTAGRQGREGAARGSGSVPTALQVERASWPRRRRLASRRAQAGGWEPGPPHPGPSRAPALPGNSQSGRCPGRTRATQELREVDAERKRHRAHAGACCGYRGLGSGAAQPDAALLGGAEPASGTARGGPEAGRGSPRGQQWARPDSSGVQGPRPPGQGLAAGQFGQALRGPPPQEPSPANLRGRARRRVRAPNPAEWQAEGKRIQQFEPKSHEPPECRDVNSVPSRSQEGESV